MLLSFKKNTGTPFVKVASKICTKHASTFCQDTKFEFWLQLPFVKVPLLSRWSGGLIDSCRKTFWQGLLILGCGWILLSRFWWSFVKIIEPFSGAILPQPQNQQTPEERLGPPFSFCWCLPAWQERPLCLVSWPLHRCLTCHQSACSCHALGTTLLCPCCQGDLGRCSLTPTPPLPPGPVMHFFGPSLPTETDQVEFIPSVEQFLQPHVVGRGVLVVND